MERKDEQGFRVSFGGMSDEPIERKAYDQETGRFLSSNSGSSDDFYSNSYGAPKRAPEQRRTPSAKGGVRESEGMVDLSSYSDMGNKKKYKKKKHGKLTKGKKAAIIVCSVLFVLLLGAFLYIRPLLDYNYHKITSDPDDLGFTDVINEKVINIALFGLDTREKDDFTGRSDSIMVLSINTETKKIKVISLMRDTIVKIEHNGKSYYSKINSAYLDGGPELAIKTINQNFGLDISRYATINFYGMVDIIDAVGGIEADITEDELEWKGTDNPNLNNCMEEICIAKGINVKDYVISTPGKQHLNGVQAVAYSRVRHCLSAFGTNDDFGRTDRQRHVMQQLFSSAITLPKTKYPGLIKALLPCSETSLSYGDIYTLAVNVLLGSPSFEQYRIPQTEWLMPFNYSGYGSCVYFDMDYAKSAIRAIIYDDMSVEAFVEQNPIQKTDWFASIGTRISGPDGGNTGTGEGTSSDPTTGNGGTEIGGSTGESGGNTGGNTGGGSGTEGGNTGGNTGGSGETGGNTGGNTGGGNVGGGTDYGDDNFFG